MATVLLLGLSRLTRSARTALGALRKGPAVEGPGGVRLEPEGLGITSQFLIEVGSNKSSFEPLFGSNALRTLGERESGTQHLTEAVAAYRAALQECTQARVPLDWAMTQNNLGTALRTLGERTHDTSALC